MGVLPALGAHRMTLTDNLPPVRVLCDPDDHVDVTRSLLDAHNPAAGLVVVHPTPGVGAGRGLGADVLAALGHPTTRLVAEKISGPDAIWFAITSWIRADQITDLVVLRAHRLLARQRDRLLQLRWLTGIRLTLVWHTRTVHPARDLDVVGIPHEITLDLTEVLSAMTRTTDTAAAVARDLPAVPRAEFAGFRAAAARTLGRQQFRRVDTEYAHAAASVCQALATHQHTDPAAHEHRLVRMWRNPRLLSRSRRVFNVGEYDDHLTNRAEDDYRDLGRGPLTLMLGELIADSPGRNTTLTRLRGAQAAFALHGWSLELPNLAYTVGPGLTTTALTPALVERIRARLASTVHAAALATALFTGAPINELFTWRADDLSFDGAVLGTADGRSRLYVVPPPARPLLRAARTFLQLNHPHRKGLLNGGTGRHGHTLRRSANTCGIRLGGCHPWKHTWLAAAKTRWACLNPSSADTDLYYALMLTASPLDDERIPL